MNKLLPLSEEITPGRVCGECTACCKTHEVSEIEKPAGRWCRHCRAGVGCGIYSARPKPCVDFKCSWLMGHGDDGLRPDRSKIIIDSNYIDGLGKVAMLWEVIRGALLKPLAERLRNQLLSGGLPVCLKFLSGSEELKLYLPPGAKLRPEIRDLLFELGFARIICTESKPKKEAL